MSRVPRNSTCQHVSYIEIDIIRVARGAERMIYKGLDQR